MAKKLKRKKRTRHMTHGKRKETVFSLKIVSLFLSICLLTFALIYLLIKPQSTVGTCANTKSCGSDLSLRINNNMPGFFEGHKVYPPQINLGQEQNIPVLGTTTAPGEKHIYIDLATQTLTAYQGSTLILKTLISSGKWDPSPVGNFHIWEKLRATRMSGGQGADAYDLPNVPYVMYFYNDFGLHGAYWHDNFGHPMSHGCINMRQVDAQALFEWADQPNGTTPGTAVSVCNYITANNKCVQDNPVQN